MPVDLIPGTTLPIQSSFGSPQPEGRGEIAQLAPGRQPVSMMERLSDRDDISPAELAYLSAAVRAFDRRPRKLKTIYAQAGGKTDASTGNIVLPLFTVPAGTEGHISSVLVDCPGSATINPSAPYANASSWAFIVAAGASTGPSAATADTLRPGAVAFAPTSAAGPIIPGLWTFNDTNAPVGQGGDEFYYVLHGGSIAAVLALSIQVTYRVNLFGFEDGQL